MQHSTRCPDDALWRAWRSTLDGHTGVWMAPILQIWCICVWYICEDDIWGALQAIVAMGEIQHSTRCPGDDLWWAWRSTLIDIPCMVTPWWLNSSNMTHLCLLYMCRWWLSRSASFNSREGDATLTRCPYYALWRAERLSSLDRHIVYDDAIVASNSSNMAHLCLVHMFRWSLKGSATMDHHGSIVVIDLCSWWCQMKRHEANSRPP